MKYTILKFLDVSGFTFLSPVVRLVTGEEPAKQLKEISFLIIIDRCKRIRYVVK